MLLADDKGAELIVAVGTHATLVEFLDKGRAGMASTFLTRLRVGGKLVDAKGVSQAVPAAHHPPRRSCCWPSPGSSPSASRSPSPPAGRPSTACSVPASTTSCPGSAGSSPIPGPKPSRTPPVALSMIDFRYHLVSLVSVFIALAVGIVLGAGPLKDPISPRPVAERSAAAPGPRRAQRPAEDRTGGQHEPRRVHHRSSRRLVADQLRRRAASSLVTLPGVDADAVRPLTEAVAAAGAKVTGRVDLQKAWVDPTRRAPGTKAVQALAAGVGGPGRGDGDAHPVGPVGRHAVPDAVGRFRHVDPTPGVAAAGSRPGDE